MKQDISELINATGAITELMKVFYDGLIKQSFSKAEAIQLTSNYMKVVLGK